MLCLDPQDPHPSSLSTPNLAQRTWCIVGPSWHSSSRDQATDLLYPEHILETGLHGGLGQARCLQKATRYEEQGTWLGWGAFSRVLRANRHKW